MYPRVYFVCLYILVYTNVYFCTQVYTYVYSCIFVYICVYLCVCVYPCMLVYVCVTVAECLEHWTHNPRVGGSNPLVNKYYFHHLFGVKYHLMSPVHTSPPSSNGYLAFSLGCEFNWLLSCISLGPGGTSGANTKC